MRRRVGELIQTRGRRRLPPEERRAQLLEVALRVFARSGLGQARHAEIAKEAGVAVSTVFLYFPTRDALVDAVLSRVESIYVAMAENVHTRGLGPRETLERHAEWFVESLEDHMSEVLVWLDWSTSFRQQHWQRFLAFMNRVVTIVEETIRAGQASGEIDPARDAHALARLFVGTAQILVHMKLVGTDAEAITDFSRTVLDATTGRAAS